MRADPSFGAAGMAIKAEILRLVVPWLLVERDMMVVWADIEGGEPPVEAAAIALGMHQAVRLREAIWRDGRRADALVYEALHPVWGERLGAKSVPVALEERRPAAKRPALSPPLAGDPPRNAVMVGPRVYLRPLEIEDAEAMALWSRRETETFFDNGRHVGSPIATAERIRKMAEDDPPSEIRLGIALRGGDELIGSIGLKDLDWVHQTAETASGIFCPEYRGGGYGTEAKHLLLAYAFERLGLHMVRSYVWAPNTRSAAALRKQGYRDAGRLHWTGLKNAEFVDDLVFDLLASEWRAT